MPCSVCKRKLFMGEESLKKMCAPCSQDSLLRISWISYLSLLLAGWDHETIRLTLEKA